LKKGRGGKKDSNESGEEEFPRGGGTGLRIEKLNAERGGVSFPTALRKGVVWRQAFTAKRSWKKISRRGKKKRQIENWGSEDYYNLE